MSTLVREDPVLVKQLNKLDRLNQFICDLAAVIASGDDGFESISDIANHVYDRHCSPKVKFMTPSRLDESGRTALSA